MSHNLDPDHYHQAQHFGGPDLGPTCLQRLSADDTSRQRVKFCYPLISCQYFLALKMLSALIL